MKGISVLLGVSAGRVSIKISHTVVRVVVVKLGNCKGDKWVSVTELHTSVSVNGWWVVQLARFSITHGKK